MEKNSEEAIELFETLSENSHVDHAQWASDVNPVKNNETQQRKGTQDRSMNRFEWKTSTRFL
jgi:hypothetical protein